MTNLTRHTQVREVTEAAVIGLHDVALGRAFRLGTRRMVIGRSRDTLLSGYWYAGTGLERRWGDFVTGALATYADNGDSDRYVEVMGYVGFSWRQGGDAKSRKPADYWKR